MNRVWLVIGLVLAATMLAFVVWMVLTTGQLPLHC